MAAVGVRLQPPGRGCHVRRGPDDPPSLPFPDRPDGRVDPRLGRVEPCGRPRGPGTGQEGDFLPRRPTGRFGRGSARSQRGEGPDKTACVSCHTGISYALARPAMERFVDGQGRSMPESRMVAAVGLRVEHWAELDSPRFRLMYDSDDRKKVESRGTEAVLNALILARTDASSGRGEPVEITRSALRHLWATQATEGDDAGSWDWLNFGLEPWEANHSRAFGAALAAIAVGSAPGYLGLELDEAASRGSSLASRLPPPTVPRGGLVQPDLDPRSLDELRGPADGRPGEGGG